MPAKSAPKPATRRTAPPKDNRSAPSPGRSNRASPKPEKGKKLPGPAKPAPKKPAGRPSSRANEQPTRRSANPPPAQGMSLDRKLDLIGVLLSVIGLLTLLSLLSPRNSPVIGAWVSMIQDIFGLGMYVFPFGLLAGGLWLILRNFERVPQLAPERALGFVLLFLNLLAVVHFILLVWTKVDAFELVRQGTGGGGYLGAVTASALQAALGQGGTVIALLAWFLLALAVALDLTIWEMLVWFRPLGRSLRQWTGQVGNLLARPGRPGPAPAYPELSPLPQPPGQAGAAPSIAPAPFAGPEAAISSGAARTWILPPLAQILEPGQESVYDESANQDRARLIEETLESFGAPARVIEINRGPTITQFGVEPDFIETRNGRTRVRVGKIAALADDLALALSARTVRVQAPVPGKGFVGIEVPNDEITPVALRSIMESETFGRLKSSLRFALGKNVSGHPISTDLASMPHLLIAGATGSGKSVCVNALICCLLLNNTPDQLRLIMVDPKRVELTGYNGIPHLVAPVVVEMEKVVSALQWVTREMDLRYRKMSETGARNIQEFNTRMASRPDKHMPYLVVIIDELADLMMLAPEETEKTITRLAQLARATGIHLVIATQRPSAEVVTGLIKANFSARIAFAVASMVDSRVILDQPGAERLLGRGDMLFQAPDAPAPVRLQGVFVSDNEIFQLVNYWRAQAQVERGASEQNAESPDNLPRGVSLKQMPMWEDITAPQEEGDPLLNEAIDLVRRQGRGSVSMLQRKYRIGYTRAARLIEIMEEKGIVGPPESGTGTRPVLDYGPAAPPVNND